MSYNDDLKNKLKDYYGTAMCSGNPMAVIELSKVETASDAELERLAKQAGIDTNNKNRNPFSW